MKKYFGVAVLAAVVFGFMGCSKSGNGFYEESEMKITEEMAYMDSAPSPVAMKAKGVAASNRAVEYPAETVMPEEAAADIEAFERKLIKTGNISLQVEKLETAEEEIEKWCKSYGGYISYSNDSPRQASYTVKVPCEKFDDAMASAGNFGTVLNRNINTRDVSDQFYDLQTRLETKKTLQKKMQDYLSQAKNLNEILEIERELNNATSEVEAMEGQLKRLSSQIDFSTININLSLPKNADGTVVHKETLGEKIADLFSSAGDFFGGFIIIILCIIVFGIPIVAAVALFFWLLFGKVGLLKKLFRKLK